MPKSLKNFIYQHKKILRILGIVLIIIGLVIIIYPFWPGISYQISPPKINQYAYLTNGITSQDNSDTNISNINNNLPKIRKTAPEGNRVIIPKIGVDMKIVEGTNEKVALNQGAWHMPNTSTPDKGGNTVITGHRFKYRPPSKETFYLLDKLEVGDIIIVNWEELEYDYKIIETKVVEKTAVEVLYNTSNPIVTLFTCTPLFTTKQRLVVIGELIAEE